MKTTTDTLHNIGHPASEPQLILNLLCGINHRFSTMTDYIATANPLTFTYALDQLVLKELRLANEEKVAAATALVVVGSPYGSGGYRPQP